MFVVFNKVQHMVITCEHEKTVSISSNKQVNSVQYSDIDVHTKKKNALG